MKSNLTNVFVLTYDHAFIYNKLWQTFQKSSAVGCLFLDKYEQWSPGSVCLCWSILDLVLVHLALVTLLCGDHHSEANHTSRPHGWFAVLQMVIDGVIGDRIKCSKLLVTASSHNFSVKKDTAVQWILSRPLKARKRWEDRFLFLQLGGYIVQRSRTV